MDLNKIAKNLFADLLQLDNPAVVTGVAGTILAAVGQFGLHPSTTAVAAVLTAVGAIATAVNKARGSFSVKVARKAAPKPPAA